MQMVVFCMITVENRVVITWILEPGTRTRFRLQITTTYHPGFKLPMVNTSKLAFSHYGNMDRTIMPSRRGTGRNCFTFLGQLFHHDGKKFHLG